MRPPCACGHTGDAQLDHGASEPSTALRGFGKVIAPCARCATRGGEQRKRAEGSHEIAPFYGVRVGRRSGACPKVWLPCRAEFLVGSEYDYAGCNTELGTILTGSLIMRFEHVLRGARLKAADAQVRPAQLPVDEGGRAEQADARLVAVRVLVDRLVGRAEVQRHLLEVCLVGVLVEGRVVVELRTLAGVASPSRRSAFGLPLRRRTNSASASIDASSSALNHACGGIAS